MTQSVWPNDHGIEESYGVQKALDELRCFVICPAKPPEYWNELFTLIRETCEGLGRGMGVSLTCRRAVDIVSAGIIHPEIWRDLRAADLVIADISGYNGNVMFELGVAAAWLDKDRVIIIREDRPEEPRLFDINPARQLDYTRSPLGFHTLQAKLLQLVQDAIAKAPFERAPPSPLRLPVSLDLKSEADGRSLWGPTGAHRRIVPAQGLEFGSLHNFRLGWLSLGDLVVRNVRVSGEFRFNAPRTRGVPYPPWIGVMVRGQGYLASSGHLAVLRANGEVAYTQETDGHQHQDVSIGKIEHFDASGPDFVPFDVKIDEEHWSIRIGTVSKIIAVPDLPLVFAAGRVLLEGQFCWMCVRSLVVEPFQDPKIVSEDPARKAAASVRPAKRRQGRR